MYSMPSSGWIEVVCGSMFCGKTEELIRRVRRAKIARQKVQVFKHSLDARYAKQEVASHNGVQWEAVPVESAEQIRALIDPDSTVRFQSLLRTRSRRTRRPGRDDSERSRTTTSPAPRR